MTETTTIPRLKTGIDGFDQISHGGLPQQRCTLLAGTAGSGKTVCAIQFLQEGITRFEQPGVLVTFEESPEDLFRNVHSFGWDLEAHRQAGKLAVVDASPTPGESVTEVGVYDFTALLARIEHAVRKVDAQRVTLDSIGSLFPQLSDAQLVRRELQRVVAGLRQMGVTTLMTIERTQEYGSVARWEVEEFVADNVVIVRNPLDSERRRRTIEILKLRGSTHQKGEYPFTIDQDSGMTILPLSAIELEQTSSEVRLSSGNPELDKMCGGGMFRDSIILVSGATGTGKTLMVTEFMQAAYETGERALLFAFEESREQLFRNARSWGRDFAAAEEAGLLKVVCVYPETTSLEDHFLKIRRVLEEYKPSRVAVDSLSALERVASIRTFREFVIGLTSHIKELSIAGMFTNTTSSIMGGESITEAHISTITDSIILLRYVEFFGEMRRAITVLKMRGSWHDKSIHEFVVGDTGMNIRAPFRGVSGILSGQPIYNVDPDQETDRLSGMFQQDD